MKGDACQRERERVAIPSGLSACLPVILILGYMAEYVCRTTAFAGSSHQRRESATINTLQSIQNGCVCVSARFALFWPLVSLSLSPSRERNIYIRGYRRRCLLGTEKLEVEEGYILATRRFTSLKGTLRENFFSRTSLVRRLNLFSHLNWVINNYSIYYCTLLIKLFISVASMYRCFENI